MTSGWWKISLALLALAPDPASARTLAELEKALVRPPPQATQFVEYRFSRLLKGPAVSSGTLEHLGSGAWVRSVDSPRAERVEIVADEIRMRRASGEERRIPLSRAPQLRMLLDSLAALLEGRITRLGDQFAVSLATDGDAWGLRITPKDPQLSRKVSRIDVFGTKDVPGCIEMRDPDGSASLTLLATERPPTDLPDRRAVEAHCRLTSLVFPAG